MKKFLCLLLVFGFLVTSVQAQTVDPNRYMIETSEGDIELELYFDKAPKTAQNFADLAGADKYDDTIFHRVIDGFMIQGGDYENRDGTGGESFNGGTIDDEIVADLTHKRGVISMANAGPNTNGSQFFIVQAPAPHLDGKHTIFGMVVEGLEIVDKIAKVETGSNNRPAEDVVVYGISAVESSADAEVEIKTEAKVGITSDLVFPDIDPISLEGKSAIELEKRSVIGGFPDGEFKGELLVTRAEAAKMLMNLLVPGEVFTETSGLFSDTIDGGWYMPFVSESARRGVINGYPDGTFRPGEGVNRAELSKMMVEAFELPKNWPHSFDDINDSDWFYPYMGAADYYDFFPKQIGSFSAGDKLSRNEVAVALYQYIQLGNQPETSTNGLEDLVYKETGTTSTETETSSTTSSDLEETETETTEITTEITTKVEVEVETAETDQTITFESLGTVAKIETDLRNNDDGESLLAFGVKSANSLQEAKLNYASFQFFTASDLADFTDYDFYLTVDGLSLGAVGLDTETGKLVLDEAYLAFLPQLKLGETPEVHLKTNVPKNARDMEFELALTAFNLVDPSSNETLDLKTEVIPNVPADWLIRSELFEVDGAKSSTDASENFGMTTVFGDQNYNLKAAAGQDHFYVKGDQVLLFSVGDRLIISPTGTENVEGAEIKMIKDVSYENFFTKITLETAFELEHEANEYRVLPKSQ